MYFDPQKTIVLIDGSSFLYRAYYGMRPLHTSKGIPVNAVYGFCRMIKKLIDSIGAQYMALVWDPKGKTTRHALYSDYKATRQAPPSDLFAQKEYIIKFADLIGLTQVTQAGIEADDLLLSLAQEWKQTGGSVVVVTTDKDMGQMLDKHTVMYDAFKETYFDEHAFQEKMGFPVSKLPFYFALLGDSSDAIPGVKGIGEKGATQLVQQFDSLAALYANLDALHSKRIRIALEANKDNAFLSEQLFLLRYYPTGISPDKLRFDATRWSSALPLFQELEFKSFLKQLENSIPFEHKQTILTPYTYITVTTHEKLKQVVDEVGRAGHCALDTETTGSSPLMADCVGISLCTHNGHAYYIPFGHKTGEQQLSRELVVTTLKPILEDPSCAKYMHNAKFDKLALSTLGCEVRGLKLDTMIAAYLLSQEWQRVSLKWLSLHFFDEAMLSFDDVVKQHKRKDFSYVPLDEATPYAAADAHQTYKLAELLQKQLHEQPTIKHLYETIEHPLIHVLYLMERTGIIVDAQELKALSIKVKAHLATIEAEILNFLDTKHAPINLNSPKQIEQLLFYQLQLPPQKKSAKGTRYSTDQEVLESLAPVHPVPKLILQHRELSKLLNTYLDALPTFINPHTGALHTTFSQVAVATGRLASSQPNLQNIPAGSDYGLQVRAAFKPRPGHIFISADYSQIELRVLAHMTQDENLKAAFFGDHDIHAETAARLFNVSISDVTHEQRQIGKRINFSVLYGLTPYRLSKELDIPFKQAKQYIDTYFEQYPRISVWMQTVIEDAKRDGYVSTLYGRRRYVPAIHEKNKSLFEEACRIAVNTPVQGTAADIMKLGMLKVYKVLEQHQLDAQLLLQIHDELLISVCIDQREQAQEFIQESLETVVEWTVPLKVTTRYGATWADVTK